MPLSRNATTTTASNCDANSNGARPYIDGEVNKNILICNATVMRKLLSAIEKMSIIVINYFIRFLFLPVCNHNSYQHIIENRATVKGCYC